MYMLHVTTYTNTKKLPGYCMDNIMGGCMLRMDLFCSAGLMINQLFLCWIGPHLHCLNFSCLQFYLLRYMF